MKKAIGIGCKGGSVFGGIAKSQLRQRTKGTILKNLGMARKYLCHATRIPEGKYGSYTKYGNFYSNSTD